MIIRIFIGYVQCQNCDIFLRGGGHESGTSVLQNHSKRCSKSASSGSLKLSSFFHPKKAEGPPLWVKKRITESLVTCCAKDLRPFNVSYSFQFRILSELESFNNNIQYIYIYIVLFAEIPNYHWHCIKSV